MELANNYLKTCILCGATEIEIVRHHISYYPEKVIFVCNKCHGLIHRKSVSTYSLLKPSNPLNRRL